MKPNANHTDRDDGRTIADMSQVDRPALFGLLRSKKPEQTDQDVPFTPQERRWAIMGALRATLLLAMVFVAGLGLVIILLLLLWNRGI